MFANSLQLTVSVSGVALLSEPERNRRVTQGVWGFAITKKAEPGALVNGPILRRWQGVDVSPVYPGKR